MVRFEQRAKLAELPDELVRGRNADAFISRQSDSPEAVLRGSEAHLRQPPNTPVTAFNTFDVF